MPLPLLPVAAALATGGTLVPHAAGGLIVTKAVAAGGYVAGTYLSTKAISVALAVASATLGGTAIGLSGLAASVIGGAGIMGSTLFASGITGWLMSVGLIASTPIWVPILLGLVLLLLVPTFLYSAWRARRLFKKVQEAGDGEEVVFTEWEARLVERILKILNKRRLLPE